MTDTVETDELKDQVYVTEVFEALGLEPPTRVPGNHSCPLPDHLDDDPSCWVTEDRWWCMVCDTGGDIIDLVRAVTGASFYQAKRFLAGAVDLDATEPRVQRQERIITDLTAQFMTQQANAPLRGRDRAIEYLRRKAEAREWPLFALEQLQQMASVTWDEYNLWIPHTDAQNRVVGIKLRAIYGGERKHAVSGSTFTTRLYRCWYMPKAPTAFIVEGESDCWALSLALSHTPVAVYALPSGAAKWKDEWAEELRAHDRVYVLLDNDEAGRKAAESIRERLVEIHHGGWVRIHGMPEEFKDVAEALAAGWDAAGFPPF